MHRGVKLIAVLGGANAVADGGGTPPRSDGDGATLAGKGLDAFQQEDGQRRNHAAAAIALFSRLR